MGPLLHLFWCIGGEGRQPTLLHSPYQNWELPVILWGAPSAALARGSHESRPCAKGCVVRALKLSVLVASRRHCHCSVCSGWYYSHKSRLPQVQEADWNLRMLELGSVLRWAARRLGEANPWVPKQEAFAPMQTSCIHACSELQL